MPKETILVSKLFRQPQLTFWICIPIVLLIGFLSDRVVDINIHDTYFVISYWQVTVLITVLYATLALTYWILTEAKLQLILWMNITHLILTIDCIFLIWMVDVFVPKKNQNFPINDELSNYELIILTLICLILLGQVLFIINVVQALIKRKTVTFKG